MTDEPGEIYLGCRGRLNDKETDNETFEKERIEFEKEVEREKARILRNLDMRYWRH